MSEEVEETIYDEGGREELTEDGEISPQEEAFMKGYDDAEEESEDESEDDEESEDEESEDE